MKKNKLYALVSLSVLTLNALTGVTAYADGEEEDTKLNANTEQQTMIKLFKDAEDFKFKTEDDKEVISTESWQMLGTYLSNYFVPYESFLTTEATKDTNKLGVDEDTLKAYQTALVGGLGATEENAEKISRKVLSNMVDPVSYASAGTPENKQTTKRLYLGSFDRGNDSSSDFGGKDTEINFYDLLGLALGDKTALDLATKKVGSDKSLSIYWKEGNEKKVILTISTDSSSPSAGQTALLTAFRNASQENSIANSFFAAEEVPTRKKGETDKAYIDRAFRKSMYGWQLYVDTFGNLIVDNGVKRYIILPAGMNPTLFNGRTYTANGNEIKADELTPDLFKSGKEITTSTYNFLNTSNVPINNLQSLLYAKAGTITKLDIGNATISLPSEKWISETADIAVKQSDWTDDGLADSEEADRAVMRATKGKGKNTGNISFDAGAKETKSEIDKGYDEKEWLLDYLTLREYTTTWGNVEDVTVVSVEKDKIATAPLAAIDTNDLKDDVRSFFVKDLKKIEDRYEEYEKEAESPWTPTNGYEKGNRRRVFEGTILNATHQGQDGSAAILVNEQWNIFTAFFAEDIFGFDKMNDMLDPTTYHKDLGNSKLGQTAFPWAINFPKANVKDYIVVPNKDSKIPSSKEMTVINELGMTNQEKITDVDTELTTEAITTEWLDENAGALKASEKGVLDSKVLLEAGKQFGWNVYSSYLNATTLNVDDKGVLQGDGKVEPPTYDLEWKQTPKFNDDVEYETESIKEDERAKETAEDKVSAKKMNTILDMAYNVMSPVSGVKYMATWFSNKLNGILLNTHEQLTGANSSSYLTGATKYDNFNGFVYQAKLTDMSATNWLKTHFKTFAVFISIMMAFAVAFYFLKGDLSAQQAIFGFLIFVTLIQMPLSMVDGVITKSNEISTSFFTKKFNYFAIFQLENYSEHLDNKVQKAEAEEEETKEETKTPDSTSTSEETSTEASEETDSGLETPDTTNAIDEYTYELSLAQASNAESGAGISVRWMSPRKDNYAGALTTALNKNLKLDDLLFGLTMGGAKNDKKNQTIEGNVGSLYVTRQLSDITSTSRTIWGNILGNGQNHATNEPSEVLENSTKSLSTQVNSYLTSDEATGGFKTREKNGFINKSAKETGSQQEKYKHVYGPLLSNDVGKATYDIKSKDISMDSKLGISTYSFNGTYTTFLQDAAGFQEEINYSASRDAQSQDEMESTSGVEQDPKVVAGTLAYSLFSESPYYSFSWNLMDIGMKSDTNTKGSTKDLLLGNAEGKSSFFYNKDIDSSLVGYNELKDFMDVGSLFNVTIPYLKAMNDQYETLLGKYGNQQPYQGIPLTGPEANNIPKSSPDYFKYWYNYNITRTANAYSPWVAKLYACDYAQPTEIEYAGKKYKISDPLNPASYKGRPMIFSESEMKFYGLEEGNLTTVEKKIINFNKNARKAMLPLMNYYTFRDSTMTSVLSLAATFEFNKEFSQSKVNGPSYVQEPQGFSIGDISYDGYMRLILANSTGESLNYKQGEDTNKEVGTYEVDADNVTEKQDYNTQTSNADANGNIYERVLAESGPFVGLGLIINDIAAIWLMPVLRLVLVFMIAVLAVMVIITGVLTIHANLYSLLSKAVIKPILFSTLLNIGFAFLVSLFMSNGPIAITGDLFPGLTLPPGPTLTILIALEFAYVLLMFKILKKLTQNAITLGQIALSSLKFVGSAAAGLVTGGASSMAGKVSNTMNGTPTKTGSGMTFTNEDLGRGTSQSGAHFGSNKSRQTKRGQLKQASRSREYDDRNAKQFEKDIISGANKLKRNRTTTSSMEDIQPRVQPEPKQEVKKTKVRHQAPRPRPSQSQIPKQEPQKQEKEVKDTQQYEPEPPTFKPEVELKPMNQDRSKAQKGVKFTTPEDMNDRIID